ncbi:MAG: putative glycoside hydrolase [Oscillospiraceae bacterium]|nr:putative glycoside hydrolase [Oscillospiraceae bacterium]
MARKYGKHGSKIKRSKNLYKRRKSSLRTSLEVVAMVMVVGLLGFVGWNAGKAIRDYFSQTSTVSTPENESPVINEFITPSDGEPTELQTDDNPAPSPVLEFNAIIAPASVLDNSTSLAAYIQQAKNNGFDAVVLDIKDSAGYLLYNSEYEPIQDTALIKGSLTASQIFAAFDNTDIRPVARINTLADRIAPSVIEDVSYVFAQGGGRWLDNRVENDGKMWSNPFLQGTRDYNAFLVGELSAAGFTDIILANVIFPVFRAYDIGVLSPEYTSPATRYEGLVDFVLECEEHKGDARLILEMSLEDVVESYAGFNGSAELLRGKKDLPDFELLLMYSKDSFGEEYKTGESTSVVLPSNDMSALMNVLYKQAANQTSGLELMPGFNREGLSDREISDILIAFAELGYESFIIR